MPMLYSAVCVGGPCDGELRACRAPYFRAPGVFPDVPLDLGGGAEPVNSISIEVHTYRFENLAETFGRPGLGLWVHEPMTRAEAIAQVVDHYSRRNR